jgi:hypothetical protein
MVDYSLMEKTDTRLALVYWMPATTFFQRAVGTGFGRWTNATFIGQAPAVGALEFHSDELESR